MGKIELVRPHCTSEAAPGFLYEATEEEQEVARDWSCALEARDWLRPKVASMHCCSKLKRHDGMAGRGSRKVH
jgi:hypothetical protein